MLLNDDNYYSVEADREYMSCSQYQGFLECEAKQMAKLNGKWVDEPKEAFLVGNYFHSYFEGKEAHEKFLEENFSNIFKTKTVTAKKATKTEPAITETVITGKYAAFVQADKMIDVVERDELMKQFVDMPGENEKIITGEIFGVQWRGKLDKYMPDLRIIADYKTVANIWETSYNLVTKERETFVSRYGYLMRAVIYSLLEMQTSLGMTFKEAHESLLSDNGDLPEFVLLCVSKQEHPDKEILRLNHTAEYIRELDNVRERMHRIKMVKSGIRPPRRCGMCDYCRATKKLEAIRPYYELIPQFRTEREVEEIEQSS